MHSYPFVPLTAAFSIGIVLAHLGCPFYAALTLFAVSAITQCVISKSGKFEMYGSRHAKGVAPLVMIAALGCMSYALEPHATPFAPPARYYRAEILSAPKEKPKSFQIYATLRAGGCASARAALYLAKDNNAAGLQTGDVIYLRCKPKAADNEYLISQGIQCTAYVPSGAWTLSDEPVGFNLRRLAEQAKKYMIDVFYRYTDPVCAGLAAGLCLGDTAGIDKDVKQDFTATGTTHILSVSGMHVSLIYAALCALTGFVGNGGTAARIRHGVIILAIWAYAFVCGLPPAAIRAAAMASIMAAGQILGKRTHGLNCLAFSCFAMLAIEPAYLFDIGFQLSYAAVAGIIVMGRKMTDAFEIKNAIVRKIWEMSAISIAAQAATLPLCIYYFGQFPNYFLLANFIVAPASTLLIYMAVILLCLSPLPFAAALMGKLCNLATTGLLASASFISSLPHSQTTGISISLLQAVIISFLIASLYLFATKKRASYLIANLSAVCLLLTSGIIAML